MKNRLEHQSALLIDKTMSKVQIIKNINTQFGYQMDELISKGLCSFAFEIEKEKLEKSQLETIKTAIG